MANRNKKLIASSASEDLRQRDWNLDSYKHTGDILVQIFLTKDGKKLEVRTRFCSFDSFDGRPEISTQMIYEIQEG